MLPATPPRRPAGQWGAAPSASPAATFGSSAAVFTGLVRSGPGVDSGASVSGFGGSASPDSAFASVGFAASGFTASCVSSSGFSIVGSTESESDVPAGTLSERALPAIFGRRFCGEDGPPVRRLGGITRFSFEGCRCAGSTNYWPPESPPSVVGAGAPDAGASVPEPGAGVASGAGVEPSAAGRVPEPRSSRDPIGSADCAFQTPSTSTMPSRMPS